MIRVSAIPVFLAVIALCLILQFSAKHQIVVIIVQEMVFVSIPHVHATINGMALFATAHPHSEVMIQNLVLKVVLVAEVVLKDFAFAIWVGLDLTATQNQLILPRSFYAQTIVRAEAPV